MTFLVRGIFSPFARALHGVHRRRDRHRGRRGGGVQVIGWFLLGLTAAILLHGVLERLLAFADAFAPYFTVQVPIFIAAIVGPCCCAARSSASRASGWPSTPRREGLAPTRSTGCPFAVGPSRRARVGASTATGAAHRLGAPVHRGCHPPGVHAQRLVGGRADAPARKTNACCPTRSRATGRDLRVTRSRAPPERPPGAGPRDARGRGTRSMLAPSGIEGDRRRRCAGRVTKRRGAVWTTCATACCAPRRTRSRRASSR